MTDTAPTPPTADRLDTLVDAWFTLPDLAEALGIDVVRVRQLVRDRKVVAVRHGERQVLQVPARQLAQTDGRLQPIPALHGTILVLQDSGFTDTEIVEWLFDVEPALGQAPIDALRAGQRAAVRRVAQTLG